MTRLVAHVVGARPNYMKAAPVWSALTVAPGIRQQLVHTGQHYDLVMNDVFFEELPLPQPDVSLEIGSAGHGVQTARALEGLEAAFLDARPDLVVVYGDVNSTLAGALAAAKLDIPVAHVEAGLRSFDRSMPEEHNRRVTDHLSTLLLTHSESGNDNLAREGIALESIAFVGNTMIDTLLRELPAAESAKAWRDEGLERGEYALITLHRPALVDDDDLLRRTTASLDELARSLSVVFPVHPRTASRLRALGVFPERVTLLEPLPYRRFLSLEAGAAAVVTDSGGVQEETTALGVPCFTLRDNTERPVTLSHGTNTLLGLAPERIAEVPALLVDAAAPAAAPPLWDGRAGERAAAAIAAAISA